MSEKFEASLNQEKPKAEKEVTINQKNEILLDVPKDKPDLKMVASFAAEHGLSVKDEFHVTLVGGKASIRITEALQKSSESLQLREKIKALIEGVDWEVIFKPTFYYLRRAYHDPDLVDPQKTIPEIRETVIQLVEVPQLLDFYERLNALLQIEEPIQSLPHVTIFSNSSRPDKKQRGIGIYSSDDLAISNAQEVDLGLDK